MKYLFITLFLIVAAITTASAQTCGTKTQAGTECSRKVSKEGERCWQHGGQTKSEKAGTQEAGTASGLCGAATKTTGAPCKNRVKGGGKCHLHKG